MPYRFVHAADIHLDSPLKSLALRDRELAELIGNATRRAFVSVIDLCLTEQVDALLLSGDLYDGDQTSMKTARFLAENLRKLHEAGIAVFIIRGNHDALSRITRELIFPDSVRLFRGRADAIELGGRFPVVVHGISFAQPHAPDSLLPRFKPPVEGAVNIGLLHTSLGGAPGHDDYAPCAAAELHASGFHYWALGHIHKRSAETGRCTIVMPGMPQGRDINESGPKSVTLATIADDRSVTIEERLTSVAQFESVPIDLTGIADWRDLAAAMSRHLEQVRQAARSEHLVVRLRLTGSTPLAWRVRRDRDLLHEEAADRGLLVGKTWIDKIEVDCHVPGAAPGPVADPVLELRRLVKDQVVTSDAFRAEVTTIADELRRQLPPELRGVLGSDEAEFERILSELMADGAEDVLARLHATAAPGDA